MALVHTTFRSKGRLGRLSLLQYLLSANSVRISYFYFVWIIVLFPVFLYAASWRNKLWLNGIPASYITSHHCTQAQPPILSRIKWKMKRWRDSSLTRAIAERLKANSHRHTRQDKTVAPAYRPPPRRRPGRQLRLVYRSQRRCTPRKCKHAVDCCAWLNLNFFTKHHATRMI